MASGYLCICVDTYGPVRACEPATIHNGEGVGILTGCSMVVTSFPVKTINASSSQEPDMLELDAAVMSCIIGIDFNVAHFYACFIIMLF